MEKKIFKWLKIISLVCAIILVIEFSYIIYSVLFSDGESVSFDGTNALYSIKNEFVTVGSNNDNEKYLEKAKITKYDDKKVKVFEKLYNKGFNGSFFDVIQDKDSYIAVGSYEKDDNEHNNEFRSALIVKYDLDGNILFESDFQELGYSKFNSIVSVDDGYIVVGQSIYKDMTLGFSDNGGALLVKYSKDLKLEWKVNYGNNRVATYNDVLVYDDKIYVVGMDYDRIGIVAKYDDDGKLLTSNKYKYTDNLGFTGIERIDNRIIVVGAKVNGNDVSNTDALIVKYNLNCEFRDEVIYSKDGLERFNRVDVDNHNNIIVIGTTSIVSKKSAKDGVSVFRYDGLIGKFSKDLDKLSVISYGDDKDDYFTDVKCVDGKYLVTGYSSYAEGGYLSKFITYSDALKVLGVE